MVIQVLAARLLPFTRVLSLLVIAFAFHGIGQAMAQQSCVDINALTTQCLEPATLSGEPPNCFCDGIPVDPPLELACERNFGCPDQGYVGAGEFPECWCRKLKDTPDPATLPPVDPIPVPGASLGGAKTCEMFYECPSGARMEVHGGLCTCTLVLLPVVKE